MEPRLITRWEAARWAREAYDIGARCDALDSQTNALDSQTNALDRLMLLIVRLRLMLLIVRLLLTCIMIKRQLKQGAGRLLWVRAIPYKVTVRRRVFLTWTFFNRAIAEELAEERGGYPEGSDKSDYTLKTLKKKADLGRPDFAGKGDKSFWYLS